MKFSALRTNQTAGRVYEIGDVVDFEDLPPFVGDWWEPVDKEAEAAVKAAAKPKAKPKEEKVLDKTDDTKTDE